MLFALALCGVYLGFVSKAEAATPLSREDMIAHAASAVGHGYKWGAGHWTEDGARAGSCSGRCPDCSFPSGAVGADCSGFVAKVWQVPERSALEENRHPYSTFNFFFEETDWFRIDRSELRPGDALVERHGDAGHIVLFEQFGTRGRLWVYEARGCAAGIVHNERLFGPEYLAIRRHAVIESGLDLAASDEPGPPMTDSLVDGAVDSTANADAAASPGLALLDGDLRIVLSWQAAIDLDLHVLLSDGTEVNFDAECRGALDEAPFIQLDRDLIGPNAQETVTIRSLQSGPFRVSVHHFDYPDLPWDSAVTVTLVDAKGESRDRFELPGADGAFWDVLEIDASGAVSSLDRVHDAGRFPGDYDAACVPGSDL
jgi:hypothetical protein